MPASDRSPVEHECVDTIVLKVKTVKYFPLLCQEMVTHHYNCPVETFSDGLIIVESRVIHIITTPFFVIEDHSKLQFPKTQRLETKDYWKSCLKNY